MVKNRVKLFQAAKDFMSFLKEEDGREAKHLEKLNDCKKAVHAVVSKHGCKLIGTRFGVLVGTSNGLGRRIKF